MSSIVIVIPTYNPSSLLLSTLEEINQHPELSQIQRIIVNDGSVGENIYLNSIKKEENLFLINHEVNKGKGAAIKSAVDQVIKTMKFVDYIITVDSDGQHRGIDVLSLLHSIKKNGEGVHVGSRSLEHEKTPLRSYIGNVISRKIFCWMCGYSLHDTQSGLKAYPRKSFELLLSLKSNRYEFEMEAIIKVIKKKIRIFETPVATIYYDNNSSSHFRPILDSLLIVLVLLKARLMK